MMDALRAFFEMGGYGAYVWGAFAVTFVVVIGLAVSSLRSLKAREAALAALEAARKPRVRP